MKLCLNCNTNKNSEDFYAHKTNSDKLGSICKTCSKSKSYLWHKNNPQKSREMSRKCQLAKPEKYAEKSRLWKQKNKEKVINYTRKAGWKRLGMVFTIEEYDKLLVKQENKCAICGKSSVGERLAVDHNHATGKVRGLLCNFCNRVIVPLVEYRQQLIPKTLQYLEGICV